MDERDIQLALFNQRVRNRRTRGYKLAVPNVYLYQWESDFLGMTPYGYFHEYEIKTNYNDYLADFNKTKKHNLLRSYYSSPGNLTSRIPRCFYYIVHGFSLRAKELPPYAGLCVVTDSGQVKIVRTAPPLPAEKINNSQIAKIATSLCYRYWEKL